MDRFRNGYIAGFVTAIACVLVAMTWTIPSGDLNNYARNNSEVISK